MHMHACLEAKGGGPGCPECPIMTKGFCKDFLLVLEKMSRDLNKNYSGISLQNREDILSKVVTGIWHGVHQFNGRRNARFSTWAWQIYRNKRTDHFRQKPLFSEDGGKELEEFPSDFGTEREDEERVEVIIDCLKRWLPDDSNGCIRLFLDLHGIFERGLDQQDLAQHYGILPNTLNQRLRRCRGYIRRMLEAEGWN